MVFYTKVDNRLNKENDKVITEDTKKKTSIDGNGDKEQSLIESYGLTNPRILMEGVE